MALTAVVDQYNKLKTKYDVPVEPLVVEDHTFATLKNIIENTKKVATKEQKEALDNILLFGEKLF